VLKINPYYFEEMMRLNMMHLHVDPFGFSSTDVNALKRLTLPEKSVSVTLPMIINNS
jgi:hypothetical protein